MGELLARAFGLDLRPDVLWYRGDDHSEAVRTKRRTCAQVQLVLGQVTDHGQQALRGDRLVPDDSVDEHLILLAQVDAVAVAELVQVVERSCTGGAVTSDGHRAADTRTVRTAPEARPAVQLAQVRLYRSLRELGRGDVDGPAGTTCYRRSGEGGQAGRHHEDDGHALAPHGLDRVGDVDGRRHRAELADQRVAERPALQLVGAEGDADGAEAGLDGLHPSVDDERAAGLQVDRPHAGGEQPDGAGGVGAHGDAGRRGAGVAQAHLVDVGVADAQLGHQAGDAAGEQRAARRWRDHGGLDGGRRGRRDDDGRRRGRRALGGRREVGHRDGDRVVALGAVGPALLDVHRAAGDGVRRDGDLDRLPGGDGDLLGADDALEVDVDGAGLLGVGVLDVASVAVDDDLDDLVPREGGDSRDGRTGQRERCGGHEHGATATAGATDGGGRSHVSFLPNCVLCCGIAVEQGAPGKFHLTRPHYNTTNNEKCQYICYCFNLLLTKKYPLRPFFGSQGAVLFTRLS